MMHRDIFAEGLGRRRITGTEITPLEQRIAKENNLVVCFPRKDDILIFKGAINAANSIADFKNVYFYKQEDGEIKTVNEDDRSAIRKHHDDILWTRPRFIKIKCEFMPDDMPEKWFIEPYVRHSVFRISDFNGMPYANG